MLMMEYACLSDCLFLAGSPLAYAGSQAAQTCWLLTGRAACQARWQLGAGPPLA